MGNIFRFFLFSAITVFLVGCSFFNKEMSCEEILINSYEESSLNNFEKNKFKDLLENRYPQYDEMFASASKETNIEKNLLAAISFQESQWDPKAKSNMGVRGMMMVTLETAALVGVEKRLNPEQNIKGGAKYFAMLKDKNIVDHIVELVEKYIAEKNNNTSPDNQEKQLIAYNSWDIPKSIQVKTIDSLIEEVDKCLKH